MGQAKRYELMASGELLWRSRFGRRYITREDLLRLLLAQPRGPTNMITRCHPGELLREEILPAMDLSEAEIATRLELAKDELDELLAEHRSVDPALAARLAGLFGNSPEFWLNLQANFDAPRNS